jgi:zinc D-Ala-D-Ala carboxypeptidase
MVAMYSIIIRQPGIYVAVSFSLHYVSLMVICCRGRVGYHAPAIRKKIHGVDMSEDRKTPTIPRFFEELGISENVPQIRGLTRYEEAISLKIAEVGDDGREHFLEPHTVRAWYLLKQAAHAEGESVFITSAFRSVSRQVEIIREKLEVGESIEQIITECAPPGYSEHHTGRAVDISAPGAPVLEIEFEFTSAYTWLCRNAKRFGFALSYPRGNSTGYQYEPWHWYFRGDDIKR